MNSKPNTAVLGGYPSPYPHEVGSFHSWTNAYQNALRCRPRTSDSILVHVIADLIVDTLRSSPHRKLTECNQITLSEEFFDRLSNQFRHIDLTLLQALYQFIRWKINQFDFRSFVDDIIRHSFLNPYPSYLRNYISQAFNMLDIKCGVNVNACIQYFFDILVPFWVTRTSCVRMGKFIDNRKLRSTSEDGI